ncbi:hypothetical protein [Burkholderia sp. Ax-1724]|uniref:hypothetical protein n=1 Tax=Burkholderia sp. Ax-1724 TaxID=2608336 RepID=UPI001F04E45E|nr:hypothetical protein [Burkholderia sp. Ax-1724]
MEQMKQKNSWADLLDEEECLGCRIIYSIFSNFPPMPSARAYNVETGEFFPFDRMRSLPTGFAMLEAQGLAWTCNCRGRSQKRFDEQPFQYVEGTTGRDVQQIVARGVSAAEEAECDAQYALEMELCNVNRAMAGGDFRAWKKCSDDAFSNYQACRGYGGF